jgi:hypothetical protein
VDSCNQGSSPDGRRIELLPEYTNPPQLEELLENRLSFWNGMDQHITDMLSSVRNLYESGPGPNIHDYGDYFHTLVYLKEYAEKKKCNSIVWQIYHSK